MGAASSSVTASLSDVMASNQTANCTTTDVCQNTHVGNVDIAGTLNCKDITIGSNANSSSFTCSVNQSASAVANVAQSMSATASAFYGEAAVANIHQSLGVAISEHQAEACGGAGAIGSSASAGACRTGILQQNQVDNIRIAAGAKAECQALNVGVNHSNNQTTCTLGQAAKMDSIIKQKGDATAKGQDPFMILLIAIVLIALCVMVVPKLLHGVTSIIPHIHHT